MQTSSTQKIVTLLFFFIFFIFGTFIVSDYGVSNDEYQERITGFTTLKYLGDLIIPDITEKVQGDKNYESLSEYAARYYGVIFNTTTAFIETVFNIEDKKYQFLMRHYINFYIFFLSLIFFFKILKKYTNNWKISLIGVIFLILSPRIFANSFYNNRDLILLSFFIISTYFNIQFIIHQNYKNAVLASFLTALAIDTRIVGIIILVISITLIIIKNLSEKVFFKKINYIFAYLFFTCFFVIMFWPYLWLDPFSNFVFAFKSLSNFFINLENLYFGEYVGNKNLPWHYIVVWISITTPILYLLLFLFMFFNIIPKIIFFYKEGYNYQTVLNFYSFGIIFCSLSAVIIFNSTLYNGWRHLYYIYPFIILFSVFALVIILEKIKLKLLKYLFILVLILNFLHIASWMFNNHPYQYAYFNSLIKKENLHKKFDLDYWGLSYKQSFEYLFKNDNSEKIKIYNLSKYNKIYYHLFSFEENIRSRIEEVKKIEEADYLITNYHNDKTIYDDYFFNTYKIFYEIKVEDTPINTIFKKIN